MELWSVAGTVCGLVGAPLLPGIINRTKAMIAGRRGPPVLQPYYDLGRLFRKGATCSGTTTWVFRAGPIVALATVATALLLVPISHNPAMISFEGDVVLFAALFGLARFFMIIAALDTGSAFEGMGAGREAHFGALTEPALYLALAVLSLQSGSLSLAGMLDACRSGDGGAELIVFALVIGVFMIVFLSENCRVPVDDPNTHLELTMIHEVMVLDHSGPDLGFIQYAAALKLWVLGLLVTGVISPLHPGKPWLELLSGLVALVILAIGTGLIESGMARLRMPKVSRMLVGASALAVLALALAVG